MNGIRTWTLLAALLSFGGLHAQCPDSTVIVYFSNFEMGTGGLVEGGFGDWEYGSIPTMLLDSNCTSTFNNPIGAHSGNNGWGTVLRDCYENSGDTSWVELTVDLSDPAFTSAELDYWSWYEVFTNFDYIFIKVNGQQLYLNNSMAFSQVWLQQTLDLTSFLGQSTVVIRFNLFATTVVNKAGWYLDDVTVRACRSGISTAVPETGTASFRVWPNPATGVVHVRPADPDGVGEWSLYDATGRVVRQGSANGVQGTFTLPVHGLSGMHLLEWRNARGVQRERILLQ